MTKPLIAQCDKSLDFKPQREWPKALPAFAWKGVLLTAFERTEGHALDLGGPQGSTFLEAITACYPELGLAEVARLMTSLTQTNPEWARENQHGLLTAYSLHPSDRLMATLKMLSSTPHEFQTWVDSKGLGARDLAPLMAVEDVAALNDFLRSLAITEFSRSQGVQAMEWVVELFLQGRPLSDLMITSSNVPQYLANLERWRRPEAARQEDEWRNTVDTWPWPAQVQGQWQRFGDETGLEIKIRTTSPQDFAKKLQRLQTINDTWSCND